MYSWIVFGVRLSKNWISPRYAKCWDHWRHDWQEHYCGSRETNGTID
jgi:hypothetical protein